MSLHETLLTDIRAEFPHFEIRYKRDSPLQRAIGAFLAGVTFGAQRVYLTRYHTAMFGRLYVPDGWDEMGDEARYILLRHERVHLRQRRRLTGFGMGFVYLVPFFPVFLAYGRARLEWEAYVETLHATAEVYGLEAAEALRGEIVRRYVGGDYAWMWPFAKTVNRWFDEAMHALRVSASSFPRGS